MWAPFASQWSLERRDGDCSCLLLGEVKIERQKRKLRQSREGAVSDVQRERNRIWPILKTGSNSWRNRQQHEISGHDRRNYMQRLHSGDWRSWIYRKQLRAGLVGC